MNEICLSCRKHTKCGRAEHETIGCGYYVPMTNEEWLHSLNTEQLAEWIAKIVDCDCCPVKRKFCDDNPCKIRFAEWLKQPHTITKE